MNGVYAFTLILALVISVGEIAEGQLRVARMQVAEVQRLTTDSPTAEAWVQSKLQTAEASTAYTTQLTSPFGSGTSVNGATVSASLNGQTNAGSYTAYNVDTAASERRVAVTITLTGSHGVAIELRTLWRLYETTSGAGATLLSEHRLGGSLTSSTSVAGDVGGCNASDKSGCDPNSVSTQDSSTMSATADCTPGYGSGTCNGQTWNKSAYGNQSLSNGQATQGTAP